MQCWSTATQSDAPNSRPTNCGAVAMQYCGSAMVAIYGSPRKSLRRILPTFDFGNASRKRTSFGTL